MDLVWLGHCLVTGLGVGGFTLDPAWDNNASSLRFNSTLNPASLVGKLDRRWTNSYAINNHEKPCSASRHLCRWSKLLAHSSDIRRLAIDDTPHAALSSFYSASNDLASASNAVFSSKDGCFQVGTAASPLTPQSLIEAYDITQGYQKQGTRM